MKMRKICTCPMGADVTYRSSCPLHGIGVRPDLWDKQQASQEQAEPPHRHEHSVVVEWELGYSDDLVSGELTTKELLVANIPYNWQKATKLLCPACLDVKELA